MIRKRILCYYRELPVAKILNLAVVSVFFFVSSVNADGIPMKGDRVDIYSTTVLGLTNDQIVFLDALILDNRAFPMPKIKLTSEQRDVLRAEAGVAPPEIEVLPLSAAKSTCACELLNIGIRFEASKLEVPHHLLGEDLEDRWRSREDRTARPWIPEQIAMVGRRIGSPIAVGVGVVAAVLIIVCRWRYHRQGDEA